MRDAGAEEIKPSDSQTEGRTMHQGKHFGDFVGGSAIDIANEAKCDVIILGIDPACSGKATAQYRQRITRGGRDLYAGENARHWTTLAESGFANRIALRVAFVK